MSATQLPDHEARRIAQTDFELPLVLEAGAGTGKTGVLVSRIVAWCLGPGWERTQRRLAEKGAEPAPERAARVAIETLSRTVAITFTEAAAAEMETRVGRALSDLAHGTLPEALLPDALPDREATRARARRLLEHLDRLFVRTIHGFCRRLLAEDALEAGLHPRFEVDARGLQRRDAVRRAVEALLHDALGDPLDPDLVLLVRHGFGPERLEAAVVQLLEAGAGASTLPSDPLEPARIERLAVALGERFAALEAAGLESVARAGGVAQQTAVELGRLHQRLNGALPVDAAALGALADAVRARWDAVGKRVRCWARDDLTKRERECVDDAPAFSAASGRLHAVLETVQALDPALLAALHRTLRAVVVRAEADLRARGAESYAQLLRDACALLSRPHAAARARAAIDQLLVDEFQDTDAVQCRVIEALALEGAATDRPGLFLVGDPKQSIYGWRSADLAAYEAFLARVRAQSGRAPCRLTTNFRSVPAILAEVERSVAPVMAREAGVQPAFEALDPSPRLASAPAPVLPAVEHWISLAWDPDEPRSNDRTSAAAATALEAEALARDLRAAHERGICWSANGVLLRSTGDLDVYLDAMRRYGIPYAVDRERDYTHRREVLEVGALVRCVLDPNDVLALVAVLRSAWVGVPDAAWLPLWRRRLPLHLRGALDGDREAFAACARLVDETGTELASMEIPGLAALSAWGHALLHAVRVLARLRRVWQTEPIDRFVESLAALPLLETAEAARFPGPFRLANLERFLRELRLALEQSGGDRGALLRTLRRGAADERDFEAGRPREASEDAVQVMTIHQAKGLDFEQLYVLQVHKGTGSGPDDRELDVDEVDGSFEYRLVRGVATLGWFRVTARRERVEDAERVRTLYVALTRAKRRLVVAGLRSRRAQSHASLLRVGRDPARALERLGSVDAAHWDDPDGVRWVHLGRALSMPANEPESARPDKRSRAAVDPERVVADAHRLRARRTEAARRMARPKSAPASERAHALLREHLATAADEESEAAGGFPPGETRRVATAVGSALHALLERFDWRAEPEAELQRQRAGYEADLVRLAGGALRTSALARGHALLDTLVAGPLWARLRALAPRVVARELPILVAADPDAGDGPVELLAGAIDLVYRDADDALVVADFKTDRADAIDGRLDAYAEQGRVYCHALREALELERAPRFELWLLETGRVIALE